MRRRVTGMGGHQLPNEGETNVWLTPPHVLAALGPFDLDPCAAPAPRPWPTAARHLALPDDGLAAEWRGRVWLNPPYGKHVGKWVDRLAEHGDGIALIFARVETDAWQHSVWPRASAILFLHGRLFFHRPDGIEAEHNGGAPSALVAFGALNALTLAHCGLAGALVSNVARVG